MLYKLLLALVVSVSLAASLFPMLVPRQIASAFAALEPTALFGAALGIFFFGGTVEEKIGRMHFIALVAVSVLAALLANPNASGAAAASDAVLGAAVAVDPYSMAVIRFIPLPAFALAVLLLAFNFLAAQEFQAVPLLIGLAYGYFIAATKAQPQPPQPRQPQYAYGRY